MKNKLIFVLKILLVILLLGCTYHRMDSEAKKMFDIAQNYESRGDLDQSLIYINKADSISPNDHMILHQRGLLKSNLQDYEGAIEDINRSIVFDKTKRGRESKISNRALVYLEMGEIDKACSDWKRIGSVNYLERYCK